MQREAEELCRCGHGSASKSHQLGIWPFFFLKMCPRLRHSFPLGQESTWLWAPSYRISQVCLTLPGFTKPALLEVEPSWLHRLYVKLLFFPKKVNEQELIRCLAFILPFNSFPESKCLILTA